MSSTHHHPEPGGLPPSSSSVGAGAASEVVAELEERFHYKQELKRGLTFAHLVAYGVNWMGPLAPGLIFGYILLTSGGTVALPYLIAGITMLFTAASYVVMVPNFPLAGSVYNYVSKGWNPHLGFLVGWVMIIDYLLFPAVATIGGALYIQPIFPQIPFWVIVGAIGVYAITVNIIGVDLMAKTGLWLLVVQEIVVVVAFIVWAYAAQVNGVGTGTMFTASPFEFTDIGTLMAATSIAVLSFLGFDAITTLSEEANNPKRDIPRAVYGSLAVAMTMFFLTGFFGMLPLGDWTVNADDMGWVGTILYQASVAAAGPWFGALYTATFVLMTLVFNVVATAAGARLLYGMGRDNLLPKPIFGAINKRFRTPHWNITLVVALIFIIAATLDVNTIVNYINFGALAGFIMLNLAVIWMYIVKKTGIEINIRRDQTGAYYLRYLIAPLIGLAVLVWVFWSLADDAKIFGFIWLAIGIVYLAVRTKAFRELPPELEV